MRAHVAVGEPHELQPLSLSPGTSIAVNGVEVIPALGNAVSVVATGFDIFGEGGLVDSYKACVAGTHP